MRVVAGELRGRRFSAPAGNRSRPTADRVREALFSILADVHGLRVLDLFAGSGALGIEALSRGAAQATFVEVDPRAARTVEENLRSLGLDARVHRRDALAFLSGPPPEAPFDLVLCDPPYDLAPRLGEQLARLLPPLISPTARIVTESDKRRPLELPMPLLRERTYGDTRLAVHGAG